MTPGKQVPGHDPGPVPGGFVPWDELSEAALDAQIRPLVEALNRTTWVRTVFSCAGHPEEPDSVEKGRRQAHVDALVSDLNRWRAFTEGLRKSTSGVRIIEGSLGKVPDWLRPWGFGGAAPAGRHEVAQEELGGPGERSVPRHYRRLVLEPVPYNAPAATCRQTLDAALHAAVLALTQVPQSPSPRTSRASTR